MNTNQPRHAEIHQPTVDLMVAFLDGRLEERESIEWALEPGANVEQKRHAILRLLNPPWRVSLSEPWHTAWQLIEESWQGETDDQNRLPIKKIKQRLESGDRTEALISAIVKLVTPRLAVEPYENWERQIYKVPHRAKSFRDLFRVKLVSGPLVYPISLGMQTITESKFLDSLAYGLDAVITRGLDICNRTELVQPHFFLRRVYYVPEAERGDDVYEPDEFRLGIAPSAKLLSAVVSQLTKVDLPVALPIVNRWKQADSPIHTRLWAAISQDSRITSASEVTDFLLNLDVILFWDVSHFPEISELRARRFAEMDNNQQRAILQRIRRKPPRNFWPKDVETHRIERARLCWVARELRGIKSGGGRLPLKDEALLKANFDGFPDPTQMDRVDPELSKVPNTQGVAGDPEPLLLNLLDGVERLRVMEQALEAPRPNWGDSQGDLAGEWIKSSDNSSRILEDLESCPDAGAQFPRSWELFGWQHRPAEDHNANANGRDLPAEARRVLGLLVVMSDDIMCKAIWGVSQWLSSWDKYAVKVPSWSAVWLRAWPIAVETTNAIQASTDERVLDGPVESIADQPYDLDIPNTPAGTLVDVFLAALDGVRQPFMRVVDLKEARDQLINASGRSGLIAMHRMIEHLGYFLFTDREWTHKHLVRALREDNGEALTLWGAVGRGIQTTDVLRVIGNDMADKSSDNRLDREARCSLASRIVFESLHALWKERTPAVAPERVQQMIRSLDEEVRAECARVIVRFAEKSLEQSTDNPDPPTPEQLFQSSTAPFLQQVWPKERSLASPGVSEELARLPVIARGKFAEAVATIERFLVPFECWSMFDYGFTKDRQMVNLEIVDDVEKANALLRLLDRTIGTAEEAIIPHDLGDALEQVRNVATKLARTTEYRRLETVASRA